MAGDYTEITQIDAPSEAAAGNTVNVSVAIGNLYSYTSIHVACVAVLDSESRFIDWEEADIAGGGAHWFSGSFVMPNEAVTINVYSYYEGTDGYLHLDDEASKDVSLSGEVPEKPYAKIVSVDAPSQAAAGDTVTVTVTVENTSPDMHGTMVCTGNCDGVTLSEPSSQWVPSGDQAVFGLTFTMPSNSVSGTIWSWHIEDSDWVNDEDKALNVGLSEEEPEKPYAKIVLVDAPSEANEGDLVTVNVTIENTSPDMHGTMVCTGQCDDITLDEPPSQWVPSGDQAVFDLTFTMPGYDVSGTIWSWHIEDSDWVNDEDEGFGVDITTAAYEFIIGQPTAHAA